MYSGDIKQISVTEAERIINAHEPRGLFMAMAGSIYIGIDNLSDEAWVEDFKTQDDCIRRLLGMDDFT